MDNIIQWIGALSIIAGHSLNAVGPSVYPWNIVAFLIGTIAFLVWAYRIKSGPHLAVNGVSGLLGVSGLINAFV